jgi:hypothetical protein
VGPGALFQQRARPVKCPPPHRPDPRTTPPPGGPGKEKGPHGDGHKKLMAIKKTKGRQPHIMLVAQGELAKFAIYNQ